MLMPSPDWKQIFENAEWGVVVGTADGRTLAAMNPAFARMHGCTEGELIGQHVSCVFAPHRRAELEEHIQRIHREGRDIFESEHIRKDGTTFPVLVDATSIRDADGRVLYRAVYVQDISARKQAEQALRESVTLSRERLAELEQVYATAPVGLALLDCECRVLRINQRLAALDGLPVAAHLGKRLTEILPSVADTVEPVLRSVIASGEPVMELELSTTTPAMPHITALVSCCPLKTDDGRVRAVTTAVQDITQRKRAEEALQRNHNLLCGVIECTSDVVFVKDSDGRYLLINSAGAKALNRPASDVVGRDDRDIFPPELAERLRADDRRVMTGEEIQQIAKFDLAGGGPRLLMTKKCPWVDENNRVMGVIGISRDVTEREWAEREMHQLRAENTYLREELESAAEFGDIVGTSRAIREVLAAVNQVAETDSTVLITGETGTGKELIAKAIHSRSQRKDHILVKVNCAALPAGLIESELFGHEKGAFTGALTRRIGRFESADGGTIFLDEIGDLPLELQAKLLRVLQEGEFERVGAAKTFRVDVRVIAATNRDLQADVRQNRFRADLFYRLNVFPIVIPPLRERREDIPQLARHLAMKCSAKLGGKVECISPATMAALQAHDWPGNVRELQNVIERGVIISIGPVLEIGRWPPLDGERGAAAPLLTLEETERRYILSVLEHTRWRVSGENGAARILALKPTTLEARMKKLGIKRPS